MRRIYCLVGVAGAVGCGGSSQQSTGDGGPRSRGEAGAIPTTDSANDGLPTPFDSTNEGSAACAPGSISGFAPVYKPPIGPYSGACTT